jgi:anthranilate phosphoribosyltransferase
VLRAHAVAIPNVPGNAIDTCGTGGDGVRTFNVSTAAALVVAATGVPVAKHGNRAVSGSTGSADVLEVLGVVVEQAPAVLGDCLRGVGIAFLYAPALHPLLARVSAVRRELGVRTLFNLLGPLVNPAGVRRQVVGVGEARLVEPLARVLAALGHERAWVVHGAGGLDELGLEGPSTVADVRDGTVRTFTVHGREVGLQAAPNAALRVGSGAESAARVQTVLAGEAGPARDVVCLNAAAALVVAGAATDLADGVRRAQAALDSGAAAAVLDRLVRFTRRERAATG